MKQIFKIRLDKNELLRETQRSVLARWTTSPLWPWQLISVIRTGSKLSGVQWLKRSLHHSPLKTSHPPTIKFLLTVDMSVSPSIKTEGFVCVCVCVCVCVYAHARVCACMCVCVHVHARVHVWSCHIVIVQFELDHKRIKYRKIKTMVSLGTDQGKCIHH